MAVVFVLDHSCDIPSALVQRLSREGFHTLHLADCDAALATLHCVRPDLIVVDAAAMPLAAAEALLRLLGRVGERTSTKVPVLVVGAAMSDYHVLASELVRGEILPAPYASTDDVLERVRHYVEPNRPTSSSSPAAAAAAKRGDAWERGSWLGGGSGFN
jgi:DNA-binding response OmpR family regulator